MIDLKVKGHFPQELADKIARKADRLAREHEEVLAAEMVRQAKGKLGRGDGPDQIALDMRLD